MIVVLVAGDCLCGVNHEKVSVARGSITVDSETP